MNSVTAHRPLRDTAEAVSLRYRCSAPPSLSPPHILFLFGAIPFLFFRYGGGESEGGFLLREKLTEFKCRLGFAKTIFWGFGFRKTSADFPRGGGVWGGIRAGFGILLVEKDCAILFVYGRIPKTRS